MSMLPREDSRLPSRGRQGYTLLEVVFAILLVSVGLLGISGMTIMVIQSNATNEAADMATDLAQDKLEELKSALWSSPVVADLNSGNNNALESTTSFDHQETRVDELGRPGGIFTLTWNIADNLPNPGMKTAVVIVTWTDRLGGHGVSFRTFL